jgi:hypothetical protein
VPAPLVVHTAAKLTPAQEEALKQAVQTLPDDWRVMVDMEVFPHEGERFYVRIAGDGFATVSGFAGATRPEQLSAFVERTRRANQPQR